MDMEGVQWETAVTNERPWVCGGGDVAEALGIDVHMAVVDT